MVAAERNAEIRLSAGGGTGICEGDDVGRVRGGEALEPMVSRPEDADEMDRLRTSSS